VERRELLGRKGRGERSELRGSHGRELLRSQDRNSLRTEKRALLGRQAIDWLGSDIDLLRADLGVRSDREKEPNDDE
jgi:hypothetical protein